MATNIIPVIGSASQATITADTNANANTVLTRDASGNATVNQLNATNLVFTGSVSVSPAVKTAAFTTGSITDYILDGTSAAFAITLPLASTLPNIEYHYFRRDNTPANAITFTSASTMVNNPSITAQYAKGRIINDGSTWYFM